MVHTPGRPAGDCLSQLVSHCGSEMRAVAFAGMQPGGLATAAKTYKNAAALQTIAGASAIDDMLLLTTVGTENRGIGARLSHYLADLLGPAHVRVERVDETLEGDKHPARVVCNWLGGDRSPVLFFADAGLRAPTMSVAGVLPDRSWFVHSDYEHLFIRRGTDLWKTPLSNLKLTRLLGLHGLTWNRAPNTISPAMRDWLADRTLPRNVHRGVMLADADHQQLSGVRPFDLAYERHGWLFVASWINGGQGLLQRLHALDGYTGRQNLLNGLRLQVSVFTPSDVVAQRARDQFRFAALRTDDDRQGWIQAEIPSPIAAIQVVQCPLEVERIRATNRQNDRAQVSACDQLVVWVGIDPSATLLSLCTHRPRRAHLLYDASVLAVLAAKERLQAVIDALPTVEEVCFLASDSVGTGVVEHLQSCPMPGGNLRVDVTPGRTSQVSVVAAMSEFERWCLQGGKGKAVRLDRKFSEELVAPDILTQARCVSGSLDDNGMDAAELPGRFFELLARSLRDCRRVNLRRQMAPLRAMTGSGFEIHVDDDLVTVVRKGLKPRKASYRFPPGFVGGGRWFELLVGRRLREVADEVRIGVSRGHASGQSENDVVARIGHRFLLVSCKAGVQDTLDVDARKARSEARLMLGDMTLPCLAHARRASARTAAGITKHGVLDLDLDVFADNKRLRRALIQGFDRWSTVRS